MSPRVVSLLPSATELLAAFGGEALLVGRSHECDHPPTLGRVPILTSARIRGTDSLAIDEEVRAALGEAPSLYLLDTDQLRGLAPDVILTQDLCRVCSIDLTTVRGVARGLDPPPEVVSLDPYSLDEVLADLERVGRSVGMAEAAAAAAEALRARVRAAVARAAEAPGRPRVAFLEWFAPLFVGGHWTPELIELAGGAHPLNPPGARSRVVSPEELAAAAPDALILCACGLDLEASRRELHHLTHAAWWPDLPAVRAGRVALVDGDAMFNRPGPRLVDALEWLVAWLHGAGPPPSGFPFEPVD